MNKSQIEETKEYATAKIELRLSSEQEHIFWCAFGTRRWVWNWAVEKWFKDYNESGKHNTTFDLVKALNKLREDNPTEYGWIANVNTMIGAEAIKDLGISLKNYAALRKKAFASGSEEDNKNAQKGRPKFQSKDKSKKTFRLLRKNDFAFKVQSKHRFNFVWTREYGRMTVKTKESISFLRYAKIKSVNFTWEAGRFFAEFTYERTNQTYMKTSHGTIGLDLGIKHAVVSYDGQQIKFFDLSENIKKAEVLQENHQRRLSKKKHGSKAYYQQLLLVQKQYKRQANIRKDLLNKLTTDLDKNYDLVKIDDFSFKSALNLKHSHRALYRVAPCMLKSQLEYKAKWYGCTVEYIPKGTPTTQTCSSCGHVLKDDSKLTLSDRTYICPECGFTIDRDANSAINTFKYTAK